MDFIWYIYFVYLIGPILLIVLMLMRNRKIDKGIYLTSRFALISYPILVAICIAWIACVDSRPPFTEAERTEIMKTHLMGEQIVLALQAFNDKQAHYPASLEQLVPEYIEQIHPPSFGDTAWIYKRDDKGGFSLELGYDSYCGLSYPVLFNFVDLAWRRWEKGEHPQRTNSMAGADYTTAGGSEANGP
jgi:hypothetical protein